MTMLQAMMMTAMKRIQDTYVRACPEKEQRWRRRRRELAALLACWHTSAQVGITVTKERNNEDKKEEEKYQI